MFVTIFRTVRSTPRFASLQTGIISRVDSRLFLHPRKMHLKQMLFDENASLIQSTVAA